MQLHGWLKLFERLRLDGSDALGVKIVVCFVLVAMGPGTYGNCVDVNV